MGESGDKDGQNDLSQYEVREDVCACGVAHGPGEPHHHHHHAAPQDDPDALKRTPLFALHEELGAKIVEFAGYEMPVSYPLGVLKEHQHTRTRAGLFDVSHMGQVVLRSRKADAAEALERLVPVDVVGLAENRQRYGFFTNDGGGIEDDLMIANRGDHLFVVVNAACKEADVARMRAALEPDVVVKLLDNRALLALQGPAAEEVLAGLNTAVRDMAFMDVATLELAGAECWVSRSGYTGEDGFEISVPDAAAEALARALLAHDDVEPIGLGARDSLRLEAGLCLYGHDIDAETSPVEAALTWAIQKVRRPGGARAGGYPGADQIAWQMAEGVAIKRVGLRPEGRAPMREGVEIFADDTGGDPVGRITSGGFGPTVGAPVAMGYVPAALATPGKRMYGAVRGKRLPLQVEKLPFVPAGFKR
ncbi:glycine cleavage system aminomethyltransferase GcvT [Thalassococcus sp. BH17M4-6]|uniref:glycine cleavage system aminomethyltransferase GcvT n=1 Tax=Thalassococcus sp. BH17M4-6 TaxID=3413148 RepID=UPI003BD4C80B